MERQRGGLETFIKSELAFLLTVAAVASLSSFSFSQSIKKEVEEKQHKRCGICGEHCKCGQHHHRVARSLGGSDRIENDIYVGGERDKHDCHEPLDQNILKKGLVYLSPEEPAVPIEDVPHNLFKNEGVRAKVLKQFGRVFQANRKST